MPFGLEESQVVIQSEPSFFWLRLEVAMPHVMMTERASAAQQRQNLVKGLRRCEHGEASFDNSRFADRASRSCRFNKGASRAFGRFCRLAVVILESLGRGRWIYTLR